MQYTIDAKNKKIGRLASEIAVILQGKRSAKYEPRLEGEDGVVVKNIAQLDIAAKKTEGKVYYSHTGRIGRLKERTMKMVIEKKGPAEILRRTVKGMLPKNKLLAKRMKKLIIEL